jgi:2-polyprenyl-3-methyl-5-hydroxy-6-metoxy-1,4-benzoquinol methylase
MRLDLNRRLNPHELPEMMDQPCSYEQLQGCLRDIEKVNTLTFAHRPTFAWLQNLIDTSPKTRAPLHVVDVGCGGGDMLRCIDAWSTRNHISVTLTGIDLNSDAIQAAREASRKNQQIRWVHGDAFSYQPEVKIDVVISSLMTHHLEQTEIVQFLRWMEATVQRGWFINDLHRQVLPYRLFQLTTRWLPFHPFVRNDGLVSIRRSFLQKEWQLLCQSAGLPIDEITIRTYRFARLCVGHIKRSDGVDQRSPLSRNLK